MSATNPWPLEIKAAGGPDGQPLNAPATHAAAVTPSDTVAFSIVCRRLWIGTGGNVTLITAAGETVLYVVPTGAYLHVMASQVNATGTTASGIVAEW